MRSTTQIKRDNAYTETKKRKTESWMNCSTPFECKTISRNTDVIRNNSNNRSYCGRRNFCQTETINLHRQWFRIVILWTLIQLHRRSNKNYIQLSNNDEIVVEDTSTNVSPFSFYVWIYIIDKISLSRQVSWWYSDSHNSKVTKTLVL